MTSAIHTKATAKFEAILRDGHTKAAAVIDQIHRDVPDDKIVRGRAMRFHFGPQPQPQLASVHAINTDQRPLLDADDPAAIGMDGADVLGQVLNMVDLDGTEAPAETNEQAAAEVQAPQVPTTLLLDVADKTTAVHRHALSQIAERFKLFGHKIPVRWLRKLVESGDEEAQSIAEHVLNQIAWHPNVKDQRFLARQVDLETRAVMSDSYRRINCRPILDTICAHLQATGMVPIGGFASDTRVCLDFAYPEVFPLHGDESPLLIGGRWSNSDFGHGSNGLAVYVKRMWCVNGCCSENTMRQIHKGGKLPDDIRLAEDTLVAATKADQLIMRDALTSVLGRDKVDQMLASLRNAGATAATWDQYEPRLKKILGKAELDTAKKAFEGDDVVNLPSGQTRWRMSNAISWLAHSANASRAIELERLAGSIAHGESRLDADDCVIAA